MVSKKLVEVIAAVGASRCNIGLPLPYLLLFQRMQKHGIKEPAALKILLKLKKIVDY